MNRGAPCLLALVAVAFAACTSAEVRQYHRFTEVEYESRERPAAVLPGTPRDLSDEGYVLLGHIVIRQPIRSCKGTRCRNYSHERPPLESARELAAKRGGDVILLMRDGDVEREVSELNECRFLETRPNPLRPASGSILDDECIAYDVIPYVRELLVTESYVWRHEPDSVSDRSRDLWRQWFTQGPAAQTEGERAAEPADP